MNSKHFRLIGILFLFLGLATSHTESAPKLQVSAVNPASGVQGTELTVEISGNGFADDIDEVKFLKSCPQEGCDDDPGGIVMGGWTVNSSKKITVPISLLNAEISDYDIRISSSTRGRGGKGTTFRALKLFKVQSSDDPVPNNDGSAIGMNCALNRNLDEHALATVGNDSDVNPDSNVGHWLYAGGLEKVHCQSGGVSGETLAGLRMATMPGGNLRKAIRFADLNFGLVPCKEGSDCLSLGDLPLELFSPTADAIQLDVRPYKVDGHTHIHLMTPRSHDNPYKMGLSLWPEGLEQRYLIQMVNKPTQANGTLGGSHSCYIDAVADPDGFWPGDDVNVYIWGDGVFTNDVPDGLPDGYTVTTGTISAPETHGYPPTVIPGTAEGVICSNKSLSGNACPGGPKFRDALCHMLGKIPMRFTMHMEYQ